MAKSRGIEVAHLLDALRNSFEVLSKSNMLRPAAFSVREISKLSL